jgi:hypothetical protein
MTALVLFIFRRIQAKAPAEWRISGTLNRVISAAAAALFSSA